MQRSAVKYTAALALLAVRNAYPAAAAAAALPFMAFSDKKRGAPTSHSHATSHPPELWMTAASIKGQLACHPVLFTPPYLSRVWHRHILSHCARHPCWLLSRHTKDDRIQGGGIPSFFVGHIRGMHCCRAQA